MIFKEKKNMLHYSEPQLEIINFSAMDILLSTWENSEGEQDNNDNVTIIEDPNDVFNLIDLLVKK
jgi:hypothetical protein